MRYSIKTYHQNLKAKAYSIINQKTSMSISPVLLVYITNDQEPSIILKEQSVSFGELNN